MAAALAPGILLSALVAAIGYIAAPFVAKAVPIPNMVIALVVGIALNPLAARAAVHTRFTSGSIRRAATSRP